MTCAETRPLLAEYVSGTMPEEDQGAIAAHLAGCPACRAECAALRGVCRLLDRSAAPAVQVDVAALYEESARREKRRARRWRRVAVTAALAAGVLLLLAVLPRLELRVERDQLVLRWGPAAPRVEPPVPETPRLAAADEERLRRLEELAHALALDVQAQGGKQLGDQQLTEGQLNLLREEVRRLRAVTEQDVTTLTRHVEVILKGKGDTP